MGSKLLIFFEEVKKFSQLLFEEAAIPVMFQEKCVHKHFKKFTGADLCRNVLFLIKLEGCGLQVYD